MSIERGCDASLMRETFFRDLLAPLAIIPIAFALPPAEQDIQTTDLACERSLCRAVSMTIVGTIGIDTIETPFGRAENVLGGSAVHCALAAAHYGPASIVAVKGTDLPEHALDPLAAQGIDLTGVSLGQGPTFRWGGRYHLDLNTRDTLYTALGVLADFQPHVPDRARAPTILFLGNLQPSVQADVLAQTPAARLRALDTMNFWIASARGALTDVLRQVDIVIMAEEEVRQYAGVPSLRQSARAILALGPRVVVIKQGSYGAILLDGDGLYFAAPGYPLEEVRDPTGAGDAFAGGFLGALAAALDARGDLTTDDWKRALIHGNLMGAFACEGFGTSRLERLTRDEIDRRYRELVVFTHVETLPPPVR
jgi:sugar/nucleoside kinase (ribokinase family)